MSTPYEKLLVARARLKSREAMVDFNARVIADELLLGVRPSEVGLKVYAKVKQEYEVAIAEFSEADREFTEYCESKQPTKEPSAGATAEGDETKNPEQ